MCNMRKEERQILKKMENGNYHFIDRNRIFFEKNMGKWFSIFLLYVMIEKIVQDNTGCGLKQRRIG